MTQIWTIEDVARRLNVATSTCYRLLKKKQLPAFRIQRHWRFESDKIEAWIKAREQRQREAPHAVD